MDQAKLTHRSGGVLLHPTCLPGPFGIGDFGPSARSFIDFLSSSGMRWWQMLPLNPIGTGNSPYQSFSAFAGNTLLISPDRLAEEGWVQPAWLASLASETGDRVDYTRAKDLKRQCLWRAFETFETNEKRRAHRELDEFCRREALWLDDFTLFAALRFHHQHRPWTLWEEPLRDRDPSALARARKDLARDIRYHQFVQWQFKRQWDALRRAADAKGVHCIGDMPIFVSQDSADVWAHRDLFKLRPDGNPDVVAGVPPDYFSKTGQRWGNPLYRWEAHRRKGYRWWLQRLEQSFRYFDAVRIDHFIGLARYYEIPADAPTAEQGQYQSGPGAHFMKAVFKQIEGAQLIAEDLGTVTREVKKLRDQFELPGMKVLQFAFKTPGNDYLPDRYPRNAVVYTGTHDNDTTRGWLNTVSKEERAFMRRYLRSDGKDLCWDLIEAAWGSVANTAIVPMQDVLELDSSARMNRPGEPEGNWAWRLAPDGLQPELAQKLYALNKEYRRLRIPGGRGT